MRTSHDQFRPTLKSLALLLNALSHPARLAIIEVLANRESCICGEIVEEMPLAQSSVSQHLAVLKEAGLIRGEIDGPRSCYCLDAAGIVNLRRQFDEFFDAMPIRDTTRCC